MTSISLSVRMLFLCTILLSCAGANSAGFADPLDTPAVPSALAPRVLVNGMALAGTRIVAVGQRGHILLSDDNGQHWTQSRVPVSSDLVAVQFATPLQGWAVGHDGVVLHSADGGLGWSRQLDGRSAAALLNPANAGTGADQVQVDKPFLDVWFRDEQYGYIVGAFNLILHTEDGGRSWQSWQDKVDNPMGYHLNAIRAIGNDLYIAGEQGLVLKLNSDGSRFTAMPTPYQGSFFGLTGKAGAVIVYGLRGNVYRSADAGLSWQKIDTGVQTGLTAGTVLADGSIVLLSQAGQVLQSHDDGRGFQLLKPTKPGPASAILATQNNTLLIGGARGLRTQAINAH